MRLLFLSQLFSTLSLFGLIWFVQSVHYPLFAIVGEPRLREYAARHATRTTWVVAPLMLVELASACALLFSRFRPAFVSAKEAFLGVALVAVIWLSTAAVQVPLHKALQAGGDSRAIRRLVTTNWLRTFVWTLRAGLLLVWAARMVPA